MIPLSFKIFKDLIVGSSLEKTLTTGGTFLCVLKIQLKAIRSGDRFWFENNDKHAKFTSKQLAELRKSTFSRILCENTENIQKVPKDAFIQLNKGTNSLVSCSELPKVDLSLFKV